MLNIPAWTDYPVPGEDRPNYAAPARRCSILKYDGDKYVRVALENGLGVMQIKSGYVYQLPVGNKTPFHHKYLEQLEEE